MRFELIEQMPISTPEQVKEFREVAIKEIKQCHAVMKEAQRLLRNGASGSIVDTVWSDSSQNTTLYELMHKQTGVVT